MYVSQGQISLTTRWTLPPNSLIVECKIRLGQEAVLEIPASARVIGCDIVCEGTRIQIEGSGHLSSCLIRQASPDPVDTLLSDLGKELT